MKFLLPVLLAAPAVMGRACRARPRTTTTKYVSIPAHTQETSVVFSSTFISQPTEPAIPDSTVSIPVVDLPSSIEDVVVTTSIAEEPTTLVTSVAPATTSDDSESGSGSGSGSEPDTSEGSTDLGGSAISGSSTWYGGNLAGGTCSFSTYTLPAGLYGTAFSGQVWNSAANCGACIEITGPTGTITAMVRPPCQTLSLDLLTLDVDRGPVPRM